MHLKHNNIPVDLLMARAWLEVVAVVALLSLAIALCFAPSLTFKTMGVSECVTSLCVACWLMAQRPKKRFFTKVAWSLYWLALADSIYALGAHVNNRYPWHHLGDFAFGAAALLMAHTMWFEALKSGKRRDWAISFFIAVLCLALQYPLILQPLMWRHDMAMVAKLSGWIYASSCALMFGPVMPLAWRTMSRQYLTSLHGLMLMGISDIVLRMSAVREHAPMAHGGEAGWAVGLGLACWGCASAPRTYTGLKIEASGLASWASMRCGLGIVMTLLPAVWAGQALYRWGLVDLDLHAWATTVWLGWAAAALGNRLAWQVGQQRWAWQQAWQSWARYVQNAATTRACERACFAHDMAAPLAALEICLMPPPSLARTDVAYKQVSDVAISALRTLRTLWHDCSPRPARWPRHDPNAWSQVQVMQSADEVVHAAVRAARVRHRQAAVTLTVAMAQAVDVALHRDEAHAMTLALNVVLDNACEAYGGKSGHIWVLAKRDVRALDVTVLDKAGGISSSCAQDLLQRRVKSRKSKGQGLGLLSASRRLAEVGGSAKVANDGSLGTQVTLRVPCAAESISPNDTDTGRCVVIDDDPLIVQAWQTTYNAETNRLLTFDSLSQFLVGRGVMPKANGFIDWSLVCDTLGFGPKARHLKCLNGPHLNKLAQLQKALRTLGISHTTITTAQPEELLRLKTLDFALADKRPRAPLSGA